MLRNGALNFRCELVKPGDSAADNTRMDLQTQNGEMQDVQFQSTADSVTHDAEMRAVDGSTCEKHDAADTNSAGLNSHQETLEISAANQMSSVNSHQPEVTSNRNNSADRSFEMDMTDEKLVVTDLWSPLSFSLIIRSFSCA